MASTYAGMFGSGDWATPQERPKNYLEKAFELWPDSPGKFLMILSKLGNARMVDDYDFTIFEERLFERAFTVNGSHNSSVTSIAIDAPSNPGQGIVAGDLLKNPLTGEILLVVTDPVSPWTSITVNRGHGGTSGATIADNTVLRYIGTVYGEGSRAPKARMKGWDRVTNYTQQFLNTCKVTTSSEQIRSRPKKSWPHAKKDAFVRHRMGIAEALYHGTKWEGTDSEGNRMTTTGGLDEWITTNVWDASSGVSLDDLEDKAAELFAYGGSEVKMGLCGLTAFNTINRAVSRSSLGTWAISDPAPKNQTYGLVVHRLRTPSGIIDLVVDQLLTEDATYTSSLYVLDPANVGLVTLKGFDTKFHDNAQLPDERAHKGYWETECGLDMALEETHALWSNLTTYVP